MHFRHSYSLPDLADDGMMNDDAAAVDGDDNFDDVNGCLYCYWDSMMTMMNNSVGDVEGIADVVVVDDDDNDVDYDSMPMVDGDDGIGDDRLDSMKCVGSRHSLLVTGCERISSSLAFSLIH